MITYVNNQQLIDQFYLSLLGHTSILLANQDKVLVNSYFRTGSLTRATTDDPNDILSGAMLLFDKGLIDNDEKNLITRFLAIVKKDPKGYEHDPAKFNLLLKKLKLKIKPSAKILPLVKDIISDKSSISTVKDELLKLKKFLTSDLLASVKKYVKTSDEPTSILPKSKSEAELALFFKGKISMSKMSKSSYTFDEIKPFIAFGDDNFIKQLSILDDTISIPGEVIPWVISRASTPEFVLMLRDIDEIFASPGLYFDKIFDKLSMDEVHDSAIHWMFKNQTNDIYETLFKNNFKMTAFIRSLIKDLPDDIIKGALITQIFSNSKPDDNLKMYLLDKYMEVSPMIAVSFAKDTFPEYFNMMSIEIFKGLSGYNIDDILKYITSITKVQELVDAGVIGNIKAQDTGLTDDEKATFVDTGFSKDSFFLDNEDFKKKLPEWKDRDVESILGSQSLVEYYHSDVWNAPNRKEFLKNVLSWIIEHPDQLGEPSNGFFSDIEGNRLHNLTERWLVQLPKDEKPEMLGKYIYSMRYSRGDCGSRIDNLDQTLLDVLLHSEQQHIRDARELVDKCLNYMSNNRVEEWIIATFSTSRNKHLIINSGVEWTPKAAKFILRYTDMSIIINSSDKSFKSFLAQMDKAPDLSDISIGYGNARNIILILNKFGPQPISNPKYIDYIASRIKEDKDLDLLYNSFTDLDKDPYRFFQTLAVTAGSVKSYGVKKYFQLLISKYGDKFSVQLDSYLNKSIAEHYDSFTPDVQEWIKNNFESAIAVYSGVPPVDAWGVLDKWDSELLNDNRLGMQRRYAQGRAAAVTYGYPIGKVLDPDTFVHLLTNGAANDPENKQVLINFIIDAPGKFNSGTIDRDGAITTGELRDKLIDLSKDVPDDKKDAFFTKVYETTFNKRMIEMRTITDVKSSIVDSPIYIKDEEAPLDEERLVTVAKFNDFLALKPERKKKAESFSDYYERMAESTKNIPDLQVQELDLSEDELSAATQYFNTEHYAGKHGDIAAKILKTFTVTFSSKAYTDFIKNFKEAYDKESDIVKPAFHGTGSIAASFILRNGFKIVDSSDSSVVGRMLGDGIYFAPTIDKATQYVGDRGFGRGLGTTGYIFEMSATLGENGTHYTAAGFGGRDGIRSPEYCVYQADKQLYIMKAHQVELVKYSDLIIKEAEDMPENIITFTFGDGALPEEIGNAEVEPNRNGTSLIFTGTEYTMHYDFLYLQDFLSPETKLDREHALILHNLIGKKQPEPVNPDDTTNL